MPSFRWPCLFEVITSWLLGAALLLQQPPTTTGNVKAECPDGWKRMAGNICMWKSPDSLSWDDALVSCRRNLSHLLILHDQYYASNDAEAPSIFNETKNLTLGIPALSKMWVGVHVIGDPIRKTQEKLWWEADVPLPVRRNDSVTLFRWASGQPNLKSGRCGAVFNLSQYDSPPGSPYPSPPMQRFLVSLTDCSKKMNFICVREATPIVAKTNLTNQCPFDQWYGSEYLDTCFKAVTDYKSKAPFHDAKNACERLKGILALPVDAISTDFISDQFKIDAEFWIGLYYNNRTTVNGSLWPQPIPATDCGDATNNSSASCVYMKTNAYKELQWCYGNCAIKRLYVCQTKALPPGPPEAKVQTKILNVSADALCNQTLTCQAFNYNPCKPVIWIKDGFYIDNGLPPQGLDLTLDENLLAKLPGTAVGSLQGEYRCEVWGQRTEFRRSMDDSAGLAFALVSLEDIATFRGTVSYDLSKWSSILNESDVQANSLLYWSASDYQKLQSSVSSIFGQLTGLQIQLEGMELGSVLVNFSLYYNYTIADVPALESLVGYLGSSQSGGTWQRLMNDRIYQLLSRRAGESIASSNRQSTGIQWLSLTLTDGCPASTINGLTFKYTELGSQANSIQLCPFDSRPKAVAICQGDFVSGGTWTILPSTPCSTTYGTASTSTPGLQQLAQAVINRTNVNDVMDSASQLTSSPETMTPLDVIYTTEILNNVATMKDVSKSVAENFVKTVSNMAAVNETQLQGAGKSFRTIISAVDQFTENVDLEGSSNLTVSQSAVALQVWDTAIDQNVFGFGSIKLESTPRLETYFTSQDDEDLTISPAIEAAIVLSQEALDIGRRQQILLRNALNWNENLRISFVIYRDGSLFSNPSYFRFDAGRKIGSTQAISLNSYVISGAISGQKITNLTEPIRILFKQNQVRTGKLKYGNYSPKCVYWENDARTDTWGWSTTGVWTHSSYDNQSVLGFSRHLTNFAIIAGFSQDPDTPVSVILKAVSIIGISISIAGLSITILAQILFKTLAKGRSQMVLLNLSIALLAVDILVLVGAERTENYNGCIAVAALLLYFLLASFCWMLVEGVVQYLKFVKVFDTYTPRFMVKAALPAWGVPLIPVILVAAIDYNQFKGHANYCWLAPNAFHFAFLLPLALIWTTNLILFILIIKGITCDRPKGLHSTQKRSKLAALQVQAAVCCCVVMGLTWLFCLLSVDGSVVAMDFLFCIFNSLQGFFIFLFLNVREKPVREAWKALFRRCCSTYRPDKTSKKKNHKHDSKQSNVSVSDSHDASSDTGFCHSTVRSSSPVSSSLVDLSPDEATLSNVETIVRQTSYYHI